MTIPEANQALTDMVRSFLASIRRVAAEGGPADPIDRALAAATIVAGSIVLLWPPERKAPKVIAMLIALTKHLWQRRAWWAGS